LTFAPPHLLACSSHDLRDACAQAVGGLACLSRQLPQVPGHLVEVLSEVAEVAVARDFQRAAQISVRNPLDKGDVLGDGLLHLLLGFTLAVAKVTQLLHHPREGAGKRADLVMAIESRSLDDLSRCDALGCPCDRRQRPQDASRTPAVSCTSRR
jgi:hypothetical protein